MIAPAMSHVWADGWIDFVLRDEERERRLVSYRVRVREKVAEIARTMRCCCDFDNWEPEVITGHTDVCRIHKAAICAVQKERGQ